MFTDCPECRSQFHIHASQLSIAKGLVKCGYCGQQFNALERLQDKPLILPNKELPVIEEKQSTEPEPQFDIPGMHDEIIGAGNRRDEEYAPLQAAGSESISPEELFDDQATRPGLASRMLWLLCTIVILLLAVSQIAWFNRDELLGRYPQMLPWVKELCVQLPCKVTRFRDFSAINLINRDVRDHPRFKNTLLVNATMANQSHTIQPFPGVQLTLYDTNGQLIAHRIFQPHDYLDESINIDDGMAPNIPIHFVLEVIDSSKDAVSFEFRFL